MDIAIPSCSLQSVLTQPCQLRCESEDLSSETDITLAFRRSFPLEIILHILNFLGDKTSLTSAARVSSFFQVECERILYRDVRLLSWFAVERFLDAMVKRIWRLKAVRLLIVNPGDGWTNHQLVGTLSNSLSIMTNLQKLKLKRSFTFLKLEDLRLPSSLQSLCLYPELSTHKMAKLLHELTSLQFLDYIWDDEVPAFACSMDFLPKLTGIKSNLTSLVHIVQNRPVRRVSIAGAVEKNEWERLFMALNQSSSYIEDFNGYFLANSVDEILAAITKELPQLETLKIGVVIEDIAHCHSFDMVNVKLTGKRLRNLHISCDYLEYPFSEPPSDVSWLMEWQKQCPSLRLVTLGSSSWRREPSGWTTITVLN